jgi:hypothetical protein
VEDVAWIGAIAAVPITLAALKWLAPAVDGWFAPPSGYTPFPNAGALFFAPEPLEEARFLIAIGVPIAVAGVVRWRGTRGAPNSRLDVPVIGFQLAVLAFVGWNATRQDTDLLLFPHYVPPTTICPPTCRHSDSWPGWLSGLADDSVVPPGRAAQATCPTPASWRVPVAAAIAVVATVIWLLRLS